jgi:cytochrome c oxidase cbb3-type subunit III
MWVSTVLLLALLPASLLAQESDVALSNPFTSDADVAAGEKTFLSQCASCHGRDGRGGGAGGAPDLSTGRFKRASTDEGLFQIINKGIPGTTMPGFMLNAGPVWRLVAYIRSLNLSRRNQALPGDPARGQALYAKHGCANCHDATAPDLKLVVGNRSAEELKTAIFDPSADVPSPYWRVTATLRSGQTVKGARLNEDTFTLQIRTAEGLRSLSKPVQTVMDRSSPMPSFKDKLSGSELDDLLAYISRGAK